MELRLILYLKLSSQVAIDVAIMGLLCTGRHIVVTGKIGCNTGADCFCLRMYFTLPNMRLTYSHKITRPDVYIFMV